MSDSRLKSQNEVLLSRLFRHSNLLTSRLVFSSCCQLWVLTPLMTYGQLPQPNYYRPAGDFHPLLVLHTSVKMEKASIISPLLSSRLQARQTLY